MNDFAGTSTELDLNELDALNLAAMRIARRSPREREGVMPLHWQAVHRAVPVVEIERRVDRGFEEPERWDGLS
jgi:hypothetical protein